MDARTRLNVTLYVQLPDIFLVLVLADTLELARIEVVFNFKNSSFMNTIRLCDRECHASNVCFTNTIRLAENCVRH